MKEFKINNRIISPFHPPFVIAEIGINHEGSLEKALRMVEDAYRAGAECVKFQCHVIEDEMSHHALNTIPGNADESIYEIMNRCVLSKENIIFLKEKVESLGMIYLSTPFSRAAANFLEELNVPAYKIGSGECNNYPLIKHIASFGKPIILSTGMNDIESIKPAVEILRESGVPFALLHCTSMYPTPYNQVRLGGIQQLQECFPDALVGLSDHSLGNYTCFGAVALGATVLEKHFTSDKTWKGPDVPISIDPLELKELVVGSKNIHLALGGTKEILKEEKPTIDFAYASVVTIKPIKKGETFTEDNLWVKRPGTGDFLAKDYETLLGRLCLNDLQQDSQIKFEDVEGLFE